MASPVMRSFLHDCIVRLGQDAKLAQVAIHGAMADCQIFESLAVNNDFNPFFYCCLHTPQ